MMTTISFKPYWLIVLIVALLMAGCSGANNLDGAAFQAEAEPTGSSLSGVLPADYENALPAATQLAVGLFKLEESSAPLSPDQAAALLPLWKAYRSLTNQDSSSNQEINALIAQIQETLNEEQIKVIAEMKLTGQDMVELAQGKNLALGPGGPGGGSQGLSAEERATRQAQRFEGQGPGAGGGPGGFGPPGGGLGPGGGEMMPGGELPPGAMATPSVRETAVAQRARSGDARVSPGLVEALIAYLETKMQ